MKTGIYAAGYHNSFETNFICKEHKNTNVKISGLKNFLCSENNINKSRM